MEQTGQRGDEVTLQHRPKEKFDITVLMVTHTMQQSLDKMHLLRLRPALKVLDADPLLFISMFRQNSRRVVARTLFINRHTRLTDELRLQSADILKSAAK